jgi:hypothetical protein
LTATNQTRPRPPRRWRRWLAVAFVLQAALFGVAIVSQIHEINVTRAVRAKFLSFPDTRRSDLVTTMSKDIVRMNNQLYVMVGLLAVFSAGTLAGAVLLGPSR